MHHSTNQFTLRLGIHCFIWPDEYIPVTTSTPYNFAWKIIYHIAHNGNYIIYPLYTVDACTIVRKLV